MNYFEQMYEQEQRVALIRGVASLAYRLLISAAIIKYLIGQ